MLKLYLLGLTAGLIVLGGVAFGVNASQSDEDKEACKQSIARYGAIPTRTPAPGEIELLWCYADTPTPQR